MCNVETWLDNSVLDNELTISSYSLVRLEVVEYCCTLGMICHIYNVTCMDPENMELLGITLYNGNQSNHFCLYAVYIFHHSPNVFVWVIVVPCMQISKKVVSVPCQVIVFVFVWVIVMPHMRICKKTVSVLSGKNSSTTRLVIATKWVLHLLNVKHRTVCIDRAL